MALQPLHPFPLGETFSPPFLPLLCRWSRAQQVAGHYFRPGFISPFAKAASPSPNLPAPCTAEWPAELPESSYIYGGKGLHDTARASPTHRLTHQHCTQSPRVQPTRTSKYTHRRRSRDIYVSTAMYNNCCILGCLSGHV